MTMHLERVYYNTNGKCKRKLNAKQQRAADEHAKWLRSRGLHPDQLAEKRKADRLHKAERQPESTPRRVIPPTSDKVGNGFKKEENVYTGGNLLGIATMHKSNMVPVFRREDAEAISSMRR